MRELLTKYYLQLALMLAFGAAALWSLVVLFGFTSLETAGADATAAALGLVICFLVVFLSVVLACGAYDVWRGAKAEEALETAIWAAPVQRERLGFVLMAGGLLLLVSGATGTTGTPGWPAISGVLLFAGGAMLVGSALRDEVGPSRPFHQHLKRKKAEQAAVRRREAEKEKAEEARKDEKAGGKQAASDTANEVAPAHGEEGEGETGSEEDTEDGASRREEERTGS